MSDSDRVTPWTTCNPFKVSGGRTGVAGKFDEVPLSVLLPAWLSERASDMFTKAGITLARTVKNAATTKNPDIGVSAWDMFEFQRGTNPHAVDELLHELWKYSQSCI